MNINVIHSKSEKKNTHIPKTKTNNEQNNDLPMNYEGV